MLNPSPRTSASTTTTLCTSALCTHSWGTNLCSILLSIFLGWVTLACHRKRLSLSANLAQRRSLSASVPSFSLSFLRTLAAPNMTSFKHADLLQVLLANEAYSLPPSLLKPTVGGKLLTKELTEQPEEVTQRTSKRTDNDELEFYMVPGQSAMDSFKATGFEKLPRQKVAGASNANLGKLPVALPKLSSFGLGQLVEHQSLDQRQLMSSASASTSKASRRQSQL